MMNDQLNSCVSKADGMNVSASAGNIASAQCLVKTFGERDRLCSMVWNLQPLQRREETVSMLHGDQIAIGQAITPRTPGSPGS